MNEFSSLFLESRGDKGVKYLEVDGTKWDIWEKEQT